MNTTSLIKPQQERSKQSLERLLKSSAQQIAEGNFDNISVAAIAKQANCSIGSFYGRFKNKSALFNVVQQKVLDDALDDVSTKVQVFCSAKKESTTSPSIEDAVTFAVDLIIDLYASNPGIFRAIFLHTRTKRAPELLGRIRIFNSSCMTESEDILKSIYPDAHQNTQLTKQWISGLQVIAVYLRETILFGDPVPTDNPHTLGEMKSAATAMFTSYLHQT